MISGAVIRYNRPCHAECNGPPEVLGRRNIRKQPGKDKEMNPMRCAAFFAPWVMMVALSAPGAAADCLPAMAPTGILLSQLPTPAGSPSVPGLSTSPMQQVEPPIGPAPAKPAPSEARRFSCPSTKYVNCMPPVPEHLRPMCNPEYLQWMKEHCPGAEVVY
jgi:hypothetical protein